MYWPTQAQAIDLHRPPPGFTPDNDDTRDVPSDGQSALSSKASNPVTHSTCPPRPPGGVSWATSHELTMKVQPPAVPIDRDSYEQMCRDSQERYASMYEKSYMMWFQGDDTTANQAMYQASPNESATPGHIANSDQGQNINFVTGSVKSSLSPQHTPSKPPLPGRSTSTPKNRVDTKSENDAGDAPKARHPSAEQPRNKGGLARGPSPIPTLINGKRYLPRGSTTPQNTNKESERQGQETGNDELESEVGEKEIRELTKNIGFVALMDKEVVPPCADDGSLKASIAGTPSKDSYVGQYVNSTMTPSFGYGMVHPA